MNSLTAKIGDPIRFELIKPVKAGMLIVLAEGAIAKGKVALVEMAGSKQRSGKLGITIDEIQSVTGQTVRLRAYDEKQASNNQNDGALIMASPLPGVSAMLIPIARLMPGEDMRIEKGTRFTAVTDGTTAFEFEALAKVQPAPKSPPPGIAELYIYRNFDNRPEDPDTWPVFVGKANVGWLRPGQFIHLRFPPGTYWLHHSGLARSGEIRVDPKRPERLFELAAEGGHTYYVRQNVDRVVSMTKGPLSHMELVDEITGADEVSFMFAPGTEALAVDSALSPHDIDVQYGRPPFSKTKCYIIPNQNLAQMQAQPGAAERKKQKTAKVARQEVDCDKARIHPESAASATGPVLRDGTPVPLILRKAISSATTTVGDNVEFETSADIKVDDVVIIPKGAAVIGTVIQAQPKRRMGRAGKLNLSIEYVQLASGERIPLRATPQVSGDSHAKAVAGAVAATTVFPLAAPFMLLRHGDDLNLPEGTAITVFTNGDVPIDKSTFKSGEVSPGTNSEQSRVR
jgi:hypothetical protein